MFTPRFTFSDDLISNIKKIAVISAELNNRSFTGTVLATFEQKANSLSAHASTSIEGNPLPLTEVKRLLKSKPENIRDTEREVLNYNRILEKLNEKIRKVDDLSGSQTAMIGQSNRQRLQK